jgi:hypothetical protein
MEGSAETEGTPDELLARAYELEAEAARTHDPRVNPGARLEEAAELRRRALGERGYPVLTCSSCFRLTGWVDASGLCDACLRRAQLDAAYADPRSGWITLPDGRHELAQQPDPPLGKRLAASFGFRKGLRRAVARAWLTRVEPGETGPAAPETGYALEVAHRDEVEAADGSGLVVRFSTATHVFDGDSWVRLDSTRLAERSTLTPREFPAALPIEQLADAWGDFRAEIDAFNRHTWERELDRRETERAALAAREETLREQRGTAGLLDEDR